MNVTFTVAYCWIWNQAVHMAGFHRHMETEEDFKLIELGINCMLKNHFHIIQYIGVYFNLHYKPTCKPF